MPRSGVKWKVKRGCALSQRFTAGVLMRGIVVDDEVEVELLGGLLVDQFEKAEELLMAMARHARPDNLAVQHVERCEQRGGAVALVVVGHRSGAALLHRQARLGAVEGLDLAHMGICGSRCSIQDAMVNLRSSLLRIQGLSPFA